MQSVMNRLLQTVANMQVFTSFFDCKLFLVIPLTCAKRFKLWKIKIDYQTSNEFFKIL